MASNNSCNLPRPAASSPTRLHCLWLLIATGVLSLTLCLPSLSAQSSVQGSAQSSAAGYLAVGEPAKVAGARKAAVQAKIPLSVKPGYHVNSNSPAEEYLIPLKLTWTATGALEGGSITYPKPSMEKYEFAEKPLSVYTGNFDLVANFKVAANAPAGPGAAVGKLRYQACSNKACYQPKTIEVTVPYQIQ